MESLLNSKIDYSLLEKYELEYFQRNILVPIFER